MNRRERLGRGLGFVVEGSRFLLREPRLWFWALIPFAIDIALLYGSLAWGLNQVQFFTDYVLHIFFTNDGPWWFELIYYPLLIILSIGFTVFAFYAVVLLASVIASPFNAVLAEKTLGRSGVLLEKPFTLKGWFQDSRRLFAASLKKSVVFAFFGLIIFILCLIPGLNFVGSFLAFLIVAFDCADYSFEALQMPFGQRLTYFRRHWPEFCGMAGVLGLTLLIPGLTLLLLPSSVVGAARVIARPHQGPFTGGQIHEPKQHSIQPPPADQSTPR